MKYKKWILLGLLVGLLLSLTACGSGVPKVEWELKISGDVHPPLIFTYDNLASREMVDLTEILMAKSVGEDEVTSWSGVELSSLLSEAGAADFATITVIAVDGYAIEISADELTDAIIALKDSGEWIAEVSPDKGPIRLVTPDTPANRWVFQVIEIQVNQ
jgi:hypothetical protein